MSTLCLPARHSKSQGTHYYHRAKAHVLLRDADLQHVDFGFDGLSFPDGPREREDWWRREVRCSYIDKTGYCKKTAIERGY